MPAISACLIVTTLKTLLAHGAHLIAYLEVSVVDTLVIAAPEKDRQLKAFDPQNINRLAEAVRQSTGGQVIAVE